MTRSQEVSSSRATADKLAISLSSLCAVHCLLVPVALVAFPSVASLGLDNEAFHLWMVVGVVPLSVYGLTLGCRRHQDLAVALAGLLGLLVLIAAVVAGHDVLGEIGERATTLLGAGLIAWAHWRNFRLCGREKACQSEAA